jgi:4'-phosphopantetheinyl transferase
VAGWRAPFADEVHLWRADLDVTAEALARLGSTLTRAEVDRAAHFRFDRDGARFVAARGQLRTLLARYLDIDAGDVALVEGPHGKPGLARESGWLRFNLSHSEGAAVYAVARDREVGVDLEWIRADFPIEELARHSFSPREQSGLADLPAAERLRAAFDCWTRKEAYVKALGSGLALALDGFDVSLQPGEPVQLSLRDPGRADSRCWSIHAFDAGPGYAAAVAVEGPPVTVPDEARPIRWGCAPAVEG